ncbi:MAG: adenosine deaminase [Acidobacteria bacterium]|nr:adenosine deaminase [Acidobacteriota bacterium]MBI3424917.1 adenosine deaminase [Acidobacteriota bacterium]
MMKKQLLAQFIRRMPKVELHVHLEGSIQPATLLELARRNGVTLPADDIAGLQRWYRFTEFKHFIEIYLTISSCICTPADIELIATDFLRQQAAQNIRYSEVTFTPYTHFSTNRRIPFAEQFEALTRARAWGLRELGTRCNWVFDLARNVRPVEHSLTVAEWAIAGKDQGVVGFGLGGLEAGNPPELFAEAFARARAAGLAAVPHAGEIAGAESVRGAIEVLHARRIGHGVRCLEDPQLVELLRARQIPLEVCPTSNVCLGVAPSFAAHPLPRLLAAGLYVTLNSDDPPMFNTTLTDEYLQAAATFGFEVEQVEQLVLNGVRACLLNAAELAAMERDFQTQFAALRAELLNV